MRDLGHKIERVPLSGSAEKDPFDLRLDVHGTEWRIECKCKKRAWSDLFGWLTNGHRAANQALFIKADRTDTLVVMTLDTFEGLIR